MLIDDLRILVADTDNWARNSETESRLRAIVAAYDALAPDWDDAPEWAQWYVIYPSGARFWYEIEPERNYQYWLENDGMLRLLSYEYEELPEGLDWRLCLWKRPEQEANDDGA